MDISSLSSLFENISIDTILHLRDKVRQLDGAYRRGADIIIVSDSIRIVRGSLKYAYLDGNPPSFTNFSLYGLDLHEDEQGRTFFMLDGFIPYSLSILEANLVQKLFISEGIDIECIQPLYASHQVGDLFRLNVDGVEKHLFNIPYKLQYIVSYPGEDHSYVLHYTPHDRDGWCEPITERQSKVLQRIFNLDVTELSPYTL